MYMLQNKSDVITNSIRRSWKGTEMRVQVNHNNAAFAVSVWPCCSRRFLKYLYKILEFKEVRLWWSLLLAWSGWSWNIRNLPEEEEEAKAHWNLNHSHHSGITHVFLPEYYDNMNDTTLIKLYFLSHRIESTPSMFHALIGQHGVVGYGSWMYIECTIMKFIVAPKPLNQERRTDTPLLLQLNRTSRHGKRNNVR